MLEKTTSSLRYLNNGTKVVPRAPPSCSPPPAERPPLPGLPQMLKQVNRREIQKKPCFWSHQSVKSLLVLKKSAVFWLIDALFTHLDCRRTDRSRCGSGKDLGLGEFVQVGGSSSMFTKV